MPVFTDALIGDTTHLTAAEFGAYCLILFVTWRNNGQPLPDDNARMARVCRMTPAQWVKTRPTMVGFFDLSDGTWRQKRLEKEWVFLQEKLEKNRDNGKRGGRPKSLNNRETTKANGSVSLNPNHNPNESTQTQTQTQKDSVVVGHADAHEGTDPQPTSDAGTDPAEDAATVAARFIGLRTELWPQECGFPAPTLTLQSQAAEYLKGAPLALVIEIMERGMRTAAAQGKSATGSLKAFHRSMADAIANHQHAATVAVGSARDVNQPRSQQQSRVADVETRRRRTAESVRRVMAADRPGS